MAEYIEGKRAVMEALRSNVPLKRLFVGDNVRGDKLVAQITKRAHKEGISVKQVKRQELDRMSERGSHQGIIAVAAPFDYASGQQVIEQAAARAESHDGNALVVVLDHITDAGNLGAVIRSAEIVGASGVVIPNKRSAHVTAATYKSSAGAVAHLPIAQVANIAQFLERLKAEGFWVAGATEKAEQCIWAAPLSGRIALVMGSEGEGISRLVLEHCDFLAALPQEGKVGSLNVAQAATACMYEWMRQSLRGKC